MKLASPAKGVTALDVVVKSRWRAPASGAKSTVSFCAVGGVWNVFTNSHRTDSAAQNDLLQLRRSGLRLLPFSAPRRTAPPIKKTTFHRSKRGKPLRRSLACDFRCIVCSTHFGSLPLKSLSSQFI
jgi:hypothetical protein